MGTEAKKLDVEELNLLQGALSAAERDDLAEPLTQWESEFMVNMAERFEKYGDKIYLSEKQWNVLRKIAAKEVKA